MSPTAVPPDQRLVLQLAANRVAAEFAGSFNGGTIKLFRGTSHDQAAAPAEVGDEIGRRVGGLLASQGVATSAAG